MGDPGTADWTVCVHCVCVGEREIVCAHTYERTHTHTHTCTHTYTHARTYAHTHTYICIYIYPLLSGRENEAVWTPDGVDASSAEEEKSRPPLLVDSCRGMFIAKALADGFCACVCVCVCVCGRLTSSSSSWGTVSAPSSSLDCRGSTAACPSPRNRATQTATPPGMGPSTRKHSYKRSHVSCESGLWVAVYSSARPSWSWKG
jgi:hypothetical protein